QLVVAARHPDGAVLEVFEALAGDVVGLGDVQARDVHVQSRALHGGGAGHAEDEFQHVHPVLPHLQPEALGEDAAERLGGGVDADLRLAHVTGQGADQQNAAAAALLHQPAEVVREGELRGDVEVDDVLEAVQVAGEDRKSTRLNSSHVKISYAVF